MRRQYVHAERDLVRQPAVQLLHRAAPPRSRHDDHPIAREALRLQRSAGNEAVTSILVQRDAEPAGTKGGSAPTLKIEGFDDLPVLSFSLQSKHEIHLTLRPGKALARLAQAAASSKGLGEVTLDFGDGRSVIVKDAIISSYHVNDDGDGPLVSVTFDGTSIEHKVPKDDRKALD